MAYISLPKAAVTSEFYDEGAAHPAEAKLRGLNAFSPETVAIASGEQSANAPRFRVELFNNLTNHGASDIDHIICLYKAFAGAVSAGRIDQNAVLEVRLAHSTTYNRFKLAEAKRPKDEAYVQAYYNQQPATDLPDLFWGIGWEPDVTDLNEDGKYTIQKDMCYPEVINRYRAISTSRTPAIVTCRFSQALFENMGATVLKQHTRKTKKVAEQTLQAGYENDPVAADMPQKFSSAFSRIFSISEEDIQDLAQARRIEIIYRSDDAEIGTTVAKIDDTYAFLGHPENTPKAVRGEDIRDVGRGHRSPDGKTLVLPTENFDPKDASPQWLTDNTRIVENILVHAWSQCAERAAKATVERAKRPEPSPSGVAPIAAYA